MSSFSKQSIDSDAALRAIEGARAKANELKVAVSISVVDESGAPRASLRMDRASVGSAAIAHDKAYTVIFLGFGLPTLDIVNLVKTDSALFAGIAGRPGIALFGGGAPITVCGQVVGAIGVAGGRENDDAEILKAALAAVI